jgi:hypothetical protein
MGRQNPELRNGITQDRSPVRESRTPGSARGAGRKASPYRDRSARNDSHRMSSHQIDPISIGQAGVILGECRLRRW